MARRTCSFGNYFILIPTLFFNKNKLDFNILSAVKLNTLCRFVFPLLPPVHHFSWIFMANLKKAKQFSAAGIVLRDHPYIHHPFFETFDPYLPLVTLYTKKAYGVTSPFGKSPLPLSRWRHLWIPLYIVFFFKGGWTSI